MDALFGFLGISLLLLAGLLPIRVLPGFFEAGHVRNAGRCGLAASSLS